MADVLQQLRALADSWDDAALPIGIDEVQERAAAGPGVRVRENGPVTVPLAPHIVRRPSPRRRWIVVGATAASIVAGLIGLVTIARQPKQPPTPGVTTIDTEPASSTTSSTTSIPPTTILTASTPVATTTPPTIVAEDLSGVAAIQGSIATALAAFDSFSGTIVAHNENLDSNGVVTYSGDTTTRVTMLADGSFWAEGDPIEWQSYDPSTATARVTSHLPDGSVNYLQYNNFTSVPLSFALGLDPVPRFNGLPDDAVVEDIVSDGRAAWAVATERDPVDDASRHVSERFVIDKATGLVIGYSNVTTADDTTTRSEATMTDVTPGAELPDEFPGEFPPGANVQGGENPSTYRQHTLEEAIVEFGDALVVPSGDVTPVRLHVETGPTTVQSDNQTTITMMSTVTIEYRSGFAYASVKLSRPLPTDGGQYCRSNDGRTCVGSTGPSVVTAGALAGAPSELVNGVLSINSGPLTVVITAITDEWALELANSLAAVS